MRLRMGIGWNINNPIPALYEHDNSGYGIAGPSGYCYTFGYAQVYGRKLDRPVLARYGWRDGRHRTEVYNPFEMDHSYMGQHRIE